MGMPIEDQALEVVENTGELNIHKGKIAAWKALTTYLKDGVKDLDAPYVPDLPLNDQRLDVMNLTSYNSVRNSWVAMYESWAHPDIYITVQCDSGAVYTHVHKRELRTSDLTNARLF
jgi:hypothetical protein